MYHETLSPTDFPHREVAAAMLFATLAFAIIATCAVLSDLMTAKRSELRPITDAEVFGMRPTSIAPAHEYERDFEFGVYRFKAAN